MKVLKGLFIVLLCLMMTACGGGTTKFVTLSASEENSYFDLSVDDFGILLNSKFSEFLDKEAKLEPTGSDDEYETELKNGIKLIVKSCGDQSRIYEIRYGFFHDQDDEKQEKSMMIGKITRKFAEELGMVDSIEDIVDTMMEEYNNVKRDDETMQGTEIKDYIMYHAYFKMYSETDNDFYFTIKPTTYASKEEYDADMKKRAELEAQTKKEEEEKKQKEEEAKKAQEEKKQQEAAEKAKRHEAGTYKIGTDLPAGEYVLIASGKAYFQVSSSSTGALEDIVSNDNFENNSYITVEDGQYLKTTKAAIYSVGDYDNVSTSSTGMFKIGKDLPAGEYKITSTGSNTGYVEVSSNSSHSLGNIISNENFTGDSYITVSDGQYLKLSNAKLVK